MNIKHIFSLAALALMTAACSSEDITQQSASQSAQMLPFRATINTSVVTRGLTEATDGKTITAAWVVDEQIALVHSTLDNDNKPIVDVMTVEGVETNGSATIKGTATYINNTEDVYLVYVGHKDNMTTFKDFLGITLGDNSDKTIGQIVDIALEAMLAVGTQDGTLATISARARARSRRSTAWRRSVTMYLRSRRSSPSGNSRLVMVRTLSTHRSSKSPAAVTPTSIPIPSPLQVEHSRHFTSCYQKKPAPSSLKPL